MHVKYPIELPPGRNDASYSKIPMLHFPVVRHQYGYLTDRCLHVCLSMSLVIFLCIQQHLCDYLQTSPSIVSGLQPSTSRVFQRVLEVSTVQITSNDRSLLPASRNAFFIAATMDVGDVR